MSQKPSLEVTNRNFGYKMTKFRTIEQEKTDWSIKYLRRKGISLGRWAGRKELDAWREKLASLPEGLLLVRMENAWKTHQSRQKMKLEGKESSSHMLSIQAKRKLASLAKQSGTTSAGALESLIVDGHQLIEQERAAVKVAKETLAQKTKELESAQKMLKDCIARLSDCTVVMEGAGLSIKELTDAQKRESKKRQPEMLRALSGSSITAVLNVLLGDTFDRAND